MKIRNFVTLAFVLTLVVLAAAGCTKKKDDQCASGACGSPTAPSTACTFTLSSTSKSFPYTGGSDNVAVATQADCSWVPTPSASWLKVTEANNGSFSYTVEPNPSTDARSGTIVVKDRTVTVTQEGCPPACSYNINPPSRHFPVSGGDGTFTVNVTGGCTWKAEPDVDWIHIVDPSSCTICNGIVNYRVDRNRGGARSGKIRIGNTAHTVTQDGEAASPGPGPTTPPSFSSTKTMSAQATATCPAGTTGSSVTLSRDATETRTSAISQADAEDKAIKAALAQAEINARNAANQALSCTPNTPTCTFTVVPRIDRDYQGFNTGISITTSAGCPWTVSTSTPWIEIDGDKSGTGSGETHIRIAQNGGAARTGTVTVAGKTVTVTQTARP